LQVYRDIPSDLANVNSSSYVGVLSFKQPDGSERAKEIYIFPEELRGTGEGSFLLNQSQPNTESNSRMTNGTVSGSRITNGSVSRSRMTNGMVNPSLEASKLTVQYNGGVQTPQRAPGCHGRFSDCKSGTAETGRECSRTGKEPAGWISYDNEGHLHKIVLQINQ
jgi:hypothetical protein